VLNSVPSFRNVEAVTLARSAHDPDVAKPQLAPLLVGLGLEQFFALDHLRREACQSTQRRLTFFGHQVESKSPWITVQNLLVAYSTAAGVRGALLGDEGLGLPPPQATSASANNSVNASFMAVAEHIIRQSAEPMGPTSSLSARIVRVRSRSLCRSTLPLCRLVWLGQSANG
jgi:hypothetical protein